MGCPITLLFVRKLLNLVRLGPTPDEKDVEIAVLRHQRRVLRRQVVREGCKYSLPGLTCQDAGSEDGGPWPVVPAAAAARRAQEDSRCAKPEL